MRRRPPTWRWDTPYLIDKRYSDATSSLRLVKQNSEVLSDYADFLAAEAEHNQGNELVSTSAGDSNERHPDSIFDIEAPELEANVLLAQGNAAGRRRCWRASRTKRTTTCRITS